MPGVARVAGPTLGGELREHTDELSVRLIERAQAPITAHGGFVRLDFDTFTMDNSGTKKEDVSRTYQGFDGYTPIAAYLGTGASGWSCARVPGTPPSKPTTSWIACFPASNDW